MAGPPAAIYRFSDLTLDLVRGCLREGDRELRLRPKSFEVLTYFVTNAGRLLTKDELMQAAWPSVFVTEDSLVQCVKEIRRAMGDGAQSAIKTIPGRGYLFDLPVAVVDPGASAAPAVAPRAPARSESVLSPAWLERLRALDWRILAAAVGVLAVISGAVGWWVRAPALSPATLGLAPTVAAVPQLSIVVLPFANLSVDPDQDYFADGVTDDLTTDLSTHIFGLFVIAHNSALTFKDKNVAVAQIGRDLDVHYVLEGSVQRSGDQVMVNAELVDTQTGAHLWTERFQKERQELFALEDWITRRIAAALGSQLLPAAAQDSDPRKSDPGAADLAMQGRAVLGLQNLDQAETLFRRSLTIDERNVGAHVGLAITLTERMIGFGGQPGANRDQLLQQANDAADRALALDPKGATAHFAKGVVLRAQGRNLEAAHEYEVAISRDPNYAVAYGNLGASMYRLGQPEKAIPLIEQALRLSPRDRDASIFLWQLGTAHMFLGHDDLTIDSFLKARAANLKLGWLLYNLAAAYALKGNDEVARAYMADALNWSPTLSIAKIKAARESDDPEYLRLREETLITGLRRAGLPEE